ncbi:MAG: FeS-binding protein [Deltaproteobacteria bacterium]|nr:FeS-binding protein [Deltaproteobacteria bacterium]
MNNVARVVFQLLVVGLLFTGFAQMPIFARYYLADVPGFAWTADYYLNHVLHYGLAIVLLAFLGWRAVLSWRRPWTVGGMLLAACWVGVAGTGLVRVMKNQPDAFFPPDVVMWVDWGHLALVMTLGVVALGLCLGRRGV